MASCNIIIANAAARHRMYTSSTRRARGSPTMRSQRSKRQYGAAKAPHSAHSSVLYKRQAVALSFCILKCSPRCVVIGDRTARLQLAYGVAGDCI